MKTIKTRKWQSKNELNQLKRLEIERRQKIEPEDRLKGQTVSYLTGTLMGKGNDWPSNAQELREQKRLSPRDGQ